MDFDDIEKDIIKWRRILHENPELSFKEYETTEFIASSVHSVLFCHIDLFLLFSVPAYIPKAPHPT